MFKLLFLFPMMLGIMVMCLVGGALFLPLLAILPLVLAIGAGVFALGLAVTVLGFVVRLFAALAIGFGGLVFGAMGLGLLFVSGAVVLAIGVAMAHLFLPILVIVALVWAIRHYSSKPRAPLQIGHGSA